MFNLFKKKQSSSELAETTTLTVQPLCPLSINFDRFVKGIDNVHIDVYLSPHFTNLSKQLIYELLNERSTNNRRFTDKPSPKVREKLDAFGNGYAQMLTTAIHRISESKRIDSIQLFQIAVIKFVLTTVQVKTDQLLDEYRKESTKNSQRQLELSEHITWINRNKNNLSYQVTHELFAQLLWVEKGTVNKLRQSLLGVAWTISKEMLCNPLLRTPDTRNHEILMKHYVLLSQKTDSCYTFKRLSLLIDKILDQIGRICQIQIDSSLEKICSANQVIDKEPSEKNRGDIGFSWKDVPANMDVLFDLKKTQQSLELAEGSHKVTLKAILQSQHKANKILEQSFHQTPVVKYLLAAYETPRLYKYYFKLIPPDLLYQTLCGETNDYKVELKLKNQLKIKSSRHTDHKRLSISQLKNVKKRLAKLERKPDKDILRRFITDFVTYRRDLKSYRLVHEAMKKIHLLDNEADTLLSRSNGILHEFLAPNEYTNISESIRSHAIIKADLRGSTTMTVELEKRGLNPATHFSRNFFAPIRKCMEEFGAEKVFIEGDAVIISLFEYQESPDQWLAVAHACGLAKSMLAVIEKQNEVSRANQLPELELGIGICYSPEAPKFLYDADDRIMISSAIGDADRLSSCSWKLRHKYSRQSNLLTQVMVFQQAPDDAFKGEKGMTTFRYNLNGIELESAAYEKLQNEIVLRHLNIRLPGDKSSTRFYLGDYPDIQGETHKVVIREDRVKVWQENSENYPLTDNLYYEVVTNKKILNAVKKWGL
jgi:hypothetical protein